MRRLFNNIMLHVLVVLRALRLAVVHAQQQVRSTILQLKTRVLVPEDSRIHRRGVYFYKEGRAGEVHSIVADPGLILFKADQLKATDTSNVPGRGTKIIAAFVGARLQGLAAPSKESGILTEFFTEGTFGNKWDFDICRAGIFITFQIYFLKDCTWKAELWGSTLVE